LVIPLLPPQISLLAWLVLLDQMLHLKQHSVVLVVLLLPVLVLWPVQL
jgi:hypothetical protein